jgi:hypothetical protein
VWACVSVVDSLLTIRGVALSLAHMRCGVSTGTPSLRVPAISRAMSNQRSGVLFEDSVCALA